MADSKGRKGDCVMDLNALMANQLKSLQSTVQMSVLNKALHSNVSIATEMLESLPDAPPVAHPHKGASIDITA